MSPSDRAILIKNDDPRITYLGEWTTVQATTVNDFGNFGPAFSPTLHSTTTISSFSFPFHGSSINVMGTVNIANSSTNPNPTWQCSLDGINLGSPNIFQFPENNWSLCSQGNIPDGAHELVVNVTSKGMPFYLDYIEYRPSSSVSLENSLILINNVDPAVDFILGWGSLGGTANQTTDTNGLVNVTFIGTQLSWYGFVPTEESHNASSGEYSVDGAPFASFQLEGLSPSSNTDTLFNQLFFITPNLEMGTHVLSAKYTGKPGQTPFTLDYLIVANGSFPSSSAPPPNSGGTSTSIPKRPKNGNAKKSSNTGAILGGVVGAIVGLVIISVILFIWVKRRKRRRQDPEVPRRSIEPFQPVQSQFNSQVPLATSLISDSRGTYATVQTSVSRDTAGLTEFSSSWSSSSNPTSVITTNDTSNETASQSRRPLPPTPPISLPQLQLQKRSAGGVTDQSTRTRLQHEDSGLRLPQPVVEGVLEIPPTYSEQ